MMTLYSYWRSTAAYRVRIALNLKQIEHRIVAVDLTSGEQREDGYTARNPQGLVPLLEDGEVRISQSQAIIEYLDTHTPEPRLIPVDRHLRAAVQAFSLAIACDIHPLNNLRVLKYLKDELGQTAEAVDAWYAHWIQTGFSALERQASDGPYVFGDTLTAADLFLIPQIYNARRFRVALDAYPKLTAIDAACSKLDAFRLAAPQNQADATE